MRIGIDIDDTIADAYNLMFNLAQKFDIEILKKEGNVLTEVDEDGFYIGKIHGWSKDEIKKFFESYYKYALEKVKPKMFSSEIITKIKNEGNKIIIISSRFNNETVSNIEEITKKWLDYYKIPYDKIYTEVKDKLNVIIKENIDIIIDDDYYLCEEVAKLNKKVYLMNLESNRKKTIGSNITRVYSWLNLYEKLKNVR